MNAALNFNTYMLNRPINLSFILLIISLVFISCEMDTSHRIGELPKSDLDIKINRLDQYVFDHKASEISTSFSDFSNIYFSKIVNIKDESDSISDGQLDAFKSDEFIRELKNKTDSIFQNLDYIEKEIAVSLDLFQQATGESFIPQVYSFIGGLSYQSFLFDDNGNDGIGIGLDMFLGDAFPYEQLSAQNPAFSKYISRTFNKEHITKKVMETILDDRLGQVEGNRMLDYMIHNGKKSYLLKQFVPFVHDSIIAEYTAEQLNWCEQNQAQIWSHFLREDLFYETDFRKINKLINASPTSPGMPDEAPGQTANFIGWKIVTEFMRRNPKVSIFELQSMKNYQEILDKSKYKPK